MRLLVSIFVVGVLACSGGLCPAVDEKKVNIARPEWGTRIVATSTFSTAYSARKLADGNSAIPADCWLAADRAVLPQTITFTLAKPRKVDSVKVVQAVFDANQYRAKDFYIETSADGETWAKAGDGKLKGQDAGTFELVEFEPVMARAVRLVITSSYDPTLVRPAGLGEVEIYAMTDKNEKPLYAAAAESIAWESFKRFFKMDFVLKPAAGLWCRTSDDAKGRQIWVAEPYRLEMSFEKISGRCGVMNYRVTRTDGKAFSVLNNNVEIKSSQSGVYKIFNPVTMQQQSYKIDLPHKLEGMARSITATPVIWMQDTAGSNTFTVGMVGQDAVTDMYGFTYNLSNGGEAQGIANSYARIGFKRQWHNAAGAVSFEDAVYINADEKISWFDALEDYSKVVDRSRNYKPAAAGAIAFNPMWHTWYAHAAGIDQNEILIDTKLAAALGFRTFQIDGGWNFPASAGEHYNTTLEGDYEFHPDRFSDPKGMIKQMHQMGVKVIVHVAPFVMGAKSKTYAQMADCLVRVDGKPIEVLDPRLVKSRDFLLKAWEKLLAEYKADGLWYDFMEQIPAKADKPAAGMELVSTDMQEAYTLVMKALYDRARLLNPDVVIVLRRNSANVNSKIYCTHVWPMDAPQDYNMNRRDVVYMKTFGEGVLTHACCTSWPISESDENVARQMASIVLAGVPALSIKLAESPQRHNEIIKAWLKWYGENDRDLVTGRMTPLLPTPPSAAIRIEAGEQAFFGFFEAVTGLVTVSKPVKKITLVNAFSDRLATRLEGIHGKFEMKVYDRNWKLKSTSTVKTDKTGLNINVADGSGCFSVVLIKK